jgi:hypothetical protein
VTKLDDILIFCCLSGFFAGLVVAVATLPVLTAASLNAGALLPSPALGERRHRSLASSYLTSRAISRPMTRASGLRE